MECRRFDQILQYGALWCLRRQRRCLEQQMSRGWDPALSRRLDQVGLAEELLAQPMTGERAA